MSNQEGGSVDQAPANRSLGRSAVRACLLEGEVHVGDLARRLNWTWQRVYSVVQTVSRQQNKVLVKVRKSVYKLGNLKSEVQT